jgi:outer membrane lipoprotein SlyB
VQVYRDMKNRLLTALLSAGLLFSTAVPSVAATYTSQTRAQARARARARARMQTRARYVRHRRHVKTAKRVGIGAAGGAAIGALAGGGKGAGIGALAGAGAGALYDNHEKHRGH